MTTIHTKCAVCGCDYYPTEDVEIIHQLPAIRIGSNWYKPQSLGAVIFEKLWNASPGFVSVDSLMCIMENYNPDITTSPANVRQQISKLRLILPPGMIQTGNIGQYRLTIEGLPKP